MNTWKLFVVIKIALFLSAIVLTSLIVLVIFGGVHCSPTKKWELGMSLPYFSLLCVVLHCASLLIRSKVKWVNRIVIAVFIFLLPLWLVLIFYSDCILDLIVWLWCCCSWWVPVQPISPDPKTPDSLAIFWRCLMTFLAPSTTKDFPNLSFFRSFASVSA